MNVVWINGWGLGESYVSRIASDLYSTCNHTVINPTEDWEASARNHAGDATLVGYSLGAFLILSNPKLASLYDRVVLMAPFADFKRESRLGGQVRKGQLRYLLNWLERDRLAALDDFWNRAGIRVETDAVPNESIESLAWGIKRLSEDSVEPSALANFECWLGSDDPLLDCERMRALDPTLHVVEEAGHELEDLLKKGKVAL